MLGHDLEMSCAEFQVSRFRLHGEIGEKHALQIIVSWTIMIMIVCLMLNSITVLFTSVSVINPFSAGTDLETSESDVCKRNILTCKVDLRTERITN